MDQSKIAMRYAKAFFRPGQRKGQPGLLKEDMDTISKLYNKSPGFKMLLESPVLKTSQKLSCWIPYWKERFKKETLNFVRMVTHNKREVHLPGMCRNFINMYQEDNGIQTAVLTSAVVLSKTMAEQIQSLLEAELKSASK